MNNQSLKTRLMGGIAIAVLASSGAYAANFDIPGGDLAPALDAYQAQSGIPIVVAANAVKNVKTHGVKGDLPAEAALTRILRGTGFVATPGLSGVMEIVPEHKKTSEVVEPATRLADAVTPAHAAASVETVVVTSSKIKGDIQTVPIAITALSQEQLTQRQIAGGPDLVKEVPNLTFTKTNFTGYSIAIRGIGTQAISVTTDPAVAVAFNDTPFIRNHFFEQEFYDVSQVLVLRGPQGTLYGRNATAGVVNIISAKPTDQFEAMLSADWGNYSNRRYEGMVNIPIVGDKLDLRVAGEWTKRDGYSFNEITNSPIDGRDLWSSRTTLRWHPSNNFTSDLIWEHFQENDDRLRSGKQLCKTDPGPTSFTYTDPVTGAQPVVQPLSPQNTIFEMNTANFSQGCLPTGLYNKGDPANGDYGAFGVPNGWSLAYVGGLAFFGVINQTIDPYTATHQSTNLRNIQSTINPIYRAKSDTLEYNVTWNVTPALSFYSNTGYNKDFLWSTEDFNRFNTSPCIFQYDTSNGVLNHYPPGALIPDPSCTNSNGVINGGIFLDPQLGPANRLVVQDLSDERSWQFSQEFRVASDFKGPFNFSVGGNYMHYETWEDYYVFSNALTIVSLANFKTNVPWDLSNPDTVDALYSMPTRKAFRNPYLGGGVPTESFQYIDPNRIANLDGNGHNYFRSFNPYVLNSYAAFGEAYYDITKNLKLTGGLRWTDDQKHFPEYPSEVTAEGYGYPQDPVHPYVNLGYHEFTGRGVVNWTPKLDFTDQTMVYASYAHGYKAGGQNPPAAVLNAYNNAGVAYPTHPLTFKPEFVDAYELGTKNTAFDGALVFDADAFYYDYKGYQISQIVDRTSINFNVDATVQGAEIQATYSPLPDLKFGFNGGYENTRIKNNQYFIDLMDRTYGHENTWTIMKPWVGQSQNCVIPDYVAAALVVQYSYNAQGNYGPLACGYAYTQGYDPVVMGTYHDSWTGAPDPSHNLVPGQPYFEGGGANGYNSGTDYGYPVTVSRASFPTLNYYGFDPSTVPNNGEGFQKPVGGNSLPNAPHFTASFTADYTLPVSADWATTLHGDFYWQSQSWSRIFNDRPYDKIRGYSNVNLALILTDATGWQVMGYVKNIFDTTAITGTFLNPDDTGLTTNVFLTDPRLFGVRVTKQFTGGSDDNGGGGLDIFPADGKRPLFWLTLGGAFNNMVQANTVPYDPNTLDYFPNGGTAVFHWETDHGLHTPSQLQKTPRSGFEEEVGLIFQPKDSDWKLKANIRYGRSSHDKYQHEQFYAGTKTQFTFHGRYVSCAVLAHVANATQKYAHCGHGGAPLMNDSQDSSSEKHAIMDFGIGKDVGLGIFGKSGTGTITGGIRVAQFVSKAALNLGSLPYYKLTAKTTQKYHELYDILSDEKRSFHGMGPELSWDASNALWGNISSGRISVDWGVNASVLFGEQMVSLHHAVRDCGHAGNAGVNCSNATGTSTIDQVDPPEPADDVTRSARVTVPNLGGHIGLSMQYQNAKLSLGYRADEFFKAMDGGEWTRQTFNRGFYGPYMNVSIGLGG